MSSRWMRRVPFIVGSTMLWTFFVVGHATWVAQPSYSPVGTERFPWAVVFLGCYLLASYAAGLPELPRIRSTAVTGALLATAVSLGALSLAQTVLGAALLPRWTVVGLVATWPLWSLLCWHGVRDRNVRSVTQAIYVGHPDTQAELRSETDRAERAVHFVASLPVDASSVGAAVAADFRQLVDRSATGPDVVILDGYAQAMPDVVTEAARLHANGVRVRTPSLFSEEHFGKIPLADLERTSLLFDIGELHRARYVRSKRIFEVVFAAVALIVALPVVPILVVANALGNRGPLLYHQPRVGKGGRVFQIHKFRSMAPSSESSWTAHDDDRITAVGGFLRRSHLDELPQLWNILVGDLSLVGPRPEQPHYVDELCEKIPYFATRHLVRPGLTGWAQVKAPYASSAEDAREKLQYDLFYLRRQSAMLDLGILVRTLRSVVRREGR